MPETTRVQPGIIAAVVIGLLILFAWLSGFPWNL
jgi:hypothetical protein